MNDLALVGHQIRYEQKSYWRNPAAAFFTFAFPLVFFFILTGVAGGQSHADGLPPSVKLAQYYTPSVLAYGVMSACFLAIALTMVRTREAGILKRLRGTPLPAWALVAGVIGSSLIVAVLMTVVVLVFGVLAFGVHLPASHVPPIFVDMVVAALAFCALGVAVSTLIPNMDAGPAIVNLPYFVLVFISGTYFPVTGTMGHIANFFPLRPFIQAMFRCFDPTNHAGVWAPHDLLTIALWGAGGAVFAARHMQWSPRRS